MAFGIIKNLGPRKRDSIPTEVYTDSGNINCNIEEILDTWKMDFEHLCNNPVVSNVDKNNYRNIKLYIYLAEMHMNDPLYVSNLYLMVK